MKQLDRRHFIQASALGAGVGILSAAGARAHPTVDQDGISLATWSIVRSFRAGVWKLTDIHKICREGFELDGVEYVTSFFESPVASYLDRLNRNAADYGIRNVLIMVDGEGDMVSPDKATRMQAAVNHRKWVEIAAYLGCHTIRCNASGGGASFDEDPDSIQRAAESFSALLDYAGEFEINIVIENHGGLSSDPRWLPELMKAVNSPHFGILPDYGNYHRDADVYQAVEMAMPYAKGVSVKSQWNPDGTHPPYDLERLLRISKGSGFKGFWGIESSMARGRDERPADPEAIRKDDWQAVIWTRDVIRKVILT